MKYKLCPCSLRNKACRKKFGITLHKYVSSINFEQEAGGRKQATASSFFLQSPVIVVKLYHCPAIHFCSSLSSVWFSIADLSKYMTATRMMIISNRFYDDPLYECACWLHYKLYVQPCVVI